MKRIIKIQREIRIGLDEYVYEGKSSRASGKGAKYRQLYMDIEATTGILLPITAQRKQVVCKFQDYNDLVHKPLKDGSLNENFAFAIYFWLHAYNQGEYSVYAKGIDANIIAAHPELKELKSNLQEIVEKLPLEGFIELLINTPNSDPVGISGTTKPLCFIKNKTKQDVDPESFFGRDDDLKELGTLLESQNNQTPKKALARALIKGMGGLGKTELAYQYFSRSEDSVYLGGKLWINVRGGDVTAQIQEFDKSSFSVQTSNDYDGSIQSIWKKANSVRRY
jgi:hypothetical protein